MKQEHDTESEIDRPSLIFGHFCKLLFFFFNWRLLEGQEEQTDEGGHRRDGEVPAEQGGHSPVPDTKQVPGRLYILAIPINIKQRKISMVIGDCMCKLSVVDPYPRIR